MTCNRIDRAADEYAIDGITGCIGSVNAIENQPASASLISSKVRASGKS